MWGCGSCTETWTGLNIAHCGSCHETFVSVRHFDKHRSYGKCLDPRDLGMVKGGKGKGSQWLLRPTDIEEREPA